MASHRQTRFQRENSSLLGRVYKRRPIPIRVRLQTIRRLSRVFEKELNQLESAARSNAIQKMAIMTQSPIPFVNDLVDYLFGNSRARPPVAIPRISNVYHWPVSSPLEQAKALRLSKAAEEYVGHLLDSFPGVRFVRMAEDKNPGFDLSVFLKRSPRAPIHVEVKLSMQHLAKAVLPIAVRNREIINTKAHVFVVVTLDGIVLIRADRAREFVRHVLLEQVVDQMHAIQSKVRAAIHTKDPVAELNAKRDFEEFERREKTFHAKRNTIRFPLAPLLRDNWAIVRNYGKGARRIPKPDFL